MASFGRARRTQSSLLRPFALLVLASLLLLGARNTDVVRGSSTFLTQLLVPVQRVLADVGAAGDRSASAISQIDRLRDDNSRLQTENDRLTRQNVRLREQAIVVQQAEPVKEGDVVITAGLGIGDELRSLCPKGLVIGTIAQIQTAEAAAYNRAIITPAVDLRRLEHVLVVKTN